MTKDEFRFRWNKDDCDITFDEVAECAKEWGLYNHPRCCPMEEVRYRVLLAAGCEDAEKYNPTRDEDGEFEEGWDLPTYYEKVLKILEEKPLKLRKL